jgi:hypothetical protein
MSQQRYVSEELTYFVGRGMSEKEQYSVLVEKILKSGWLLAEPSIFSVAEAEELLDRQSAVVYGTTPIAPIEDMMDHLVVCFCDIPITDLEIHMSKYSRFGLSFLKPFLVEKGANPVLYIANNSKSLPIGPLDKEQLVGRRDLYQANYQQFKELMDFLMYSDDSPLALAASSPEAPPEQSEKLYQWLKDLWPKMYNLNSFLSIYIFSHVKYFDDATADEDPANVYMEREWRVLGDVNFSLSDVRRVFLPEEFAERFRTDLPGYSGQLTFSGEAV